MLYKYIYICYICLNSFDRYKLYSIWGINVWIIYARDVFTFCPCQIQKYLEYKYIYVKDTYGPGTNLFYIQVHKKI